MLSPIVYVRGLINKTSISKIILLALVIRIILLPLSFHSDINNHAIWGIYAEEFGLRGYYDWLNFGNYARPDYPPLAMVFFLVIRLIWKVIFNLLWQINVLIPLFPSNFIPWFERDGYLLLLKIPGVLADIGIGYLIYLFAKNKGLDDKAKFVSSLFLFNPVIIYVSSSWGQLESVVGFLALASLYAIVNKMYARGFVSYLASITVKGTMLPLAPLLFLQMVKDRVKLRKIIVPITLGIGFVFILGYYFTDSHPITWMINTYKDKFLSGPPTLPYLTVNAFNLWTLIFGSTLVRDDIQFFGVPMFILARILSIFFLVIILYRYLRQGNIFYASALIFYSTFMFLPRMHERYMYPVFIFLPLVLVFRPKLWKMFIILLVVFWLNLYNGWWFPYVPIVKSLLSYEEVKRGLSLINLVFFVALVRDFVRYKKI